MRARLALLLVAMTVALAACNLGNENRIALTRTEAPGRVVVAAVPCVGDHVTSVQLWTRRTDGEGFYARDRLLWRIDADLPVDTQRFTAGQGAQGFREVVPLTLPVQGDLVVVVRTDGEFIGRHEQYFNLEELRSDVLKRDDAPVTLEQLREEAEDCGSTPLGADAEKWIGVGVLGWLAWLVLAGGSVGIAALVNRRRTRANS